MSTIPAVPPAGESVMVKLDDLSIFLEKNNLQIVKVDEQYVYVKPREDKKDE